MCGRYALNTTAQQLIEHFQLLSCPDFAPRFNIAPPSQIPIIRWKPNTGRVGQLKAWNERNPEMPIRIVPRQIGERVKAMAMSREQRFVKSVPKEMRGMLQ